jgi:hypothetical protein
MTEDQIEQLTIARLRELGYAYQHGPAIAQDSKQHPAPNDCDPRTSQRWNC